MPQLYLYTKVYKPEFYVVFSVYGMSLNWNVPLTYRFMVIKSVKTMTYIAIIQSNKIWRGKARKGHF